MDTSNGIRYAIDIAPPEVAKCPIDGSRLVIDNRVVTASASGQVIVAGDDKNRSDPSHSMIKIKDAKGLTEVYIHLANTKVKKGDKVSQGASLGNPSCEYPPGGRNEGAHVHVGLEKDGQAIPIDGVIVGGWTIRNEPKNYDGTMTKSGEKTRTADVRRCDTDTKCGGIRNDLRNGPRKEVLGTAIGPIVTKETPNPTLEIEKQLEQGWRRFTSFSLPYRIDYPSNWTEQPSDWEKEGNYFFPRTGPNPDVQVISEPLANWITLDDFKNRVVRSMKENVMDTRKRMFATARSYTDIKEIPNQSVDGQKAWKIEGYPRAFAPLDFYRVAYAIVKDGRGWVIMYTGNSKEFNLNLPIFEKMLASFKFLK